MDRRKNDRRTDSTDIYVPDIREILEILYKRRWLIIVLVALPMLAGMFYVKNKPDIYRATSSVLLETHEINLANFRDLTSGMKYDSLTVPTQVQVILSPDMVRKTIDYLGLIKDENGKIVQTRGGTRSNGRSVAKETDDKKKFEIFKHVSENLSAKQKDASRVVEISFRSENPFLAAAIVNTHAQLYVRSREDQKKQLAEKLDNWISTEIIKLKGESLAKSRKVQEFRSANGMIQGKNSRELIYQQISSTATEIDRIETQEVDLKARIEVLKTSNPHTITDVVGSRLIQDLKSRASQAAQRLQALRAEHGANHPSVMSTKKELEQINRDINREIENIKTSIQNELDTVQKQKTLLNEKLDDLQAAAESFQEKQITLQTLQVEEKASSKLLDNFLARSEEIKSQIDFTRPDVSIVSMAQVPGEPSGSKKLITMIIVTAFSSVFALGVVFLLEIGNKGIEKKDEVKKLTGFSLLGSLPFEKLPITNVLKKQRSLYLEEIKRIYIHLDSLDEHKTILITSPHTGEGKTTIASSLAYYMTNLGKKVLLVDADTISPSVAGVTVVDSTPGLFELLAGKNDIEEVIKTDQKGLHVLPAGEPDETMSDLLLNEKLKDIVDALAKHFDYIIIDSAPVMKVSDGEMLAKITDQVIVVVEWLKTPKDDFVKTANVLRYLARHTPNVILNKIRSAEINNS